MVLNDPKSAAGRRSLILSARTLETLNAVRRRQAEYRDQVGPWWNEDAWMFPSRQGSHLKTDTVRLWFKTLCADAGLPYIGMHGLRHTYGTDMMRAGVAPRVVQERMGHSHVTTTLQLYSHPDDAMHREVADTIERVTGDRFVS